MAGDSGLSGTQTQEERIMTTAERTIEILVPVAEDVPEEVGLSASLSGLEGKVVGLLENRKYHADTFMQELEQTLINDYGVKRIVYNRKATYSAPHPDEKLEALLAECDAIIHAIAD